MSDLGKDGKEDQPPAPDWVERLAKYNAPHADPIFAVASHQTGDHIQAWQVNRRTGELAFNPPAAWRETHQFSVPKGLRSMLDGRCQAFSNEVRDGQALAVWLKLDALNQSVPYEHARAQLEKRVDTMASALKERFQLRSLETRIYYPSEKISKATRERGHEVAACVLIAVPAARVSVLNNEIKPAIQNALEQQKRLKLTDEVRPAAEISEGIVERMLAKHRDPLTHEARIERPLFALDEIGENMSADAYCTDVRSDGLFHITYPITTYATLTKTFPPKEFSNHNPSSLLVLPMRNDFSAVPHLSDEDQEKDPTTVPGVSDALNYDKTITSALAKALGNELGSTWDVSRWYDQPMGNMIILSVRHPDQKAMLGKALELVNEARKYRLNKNADWRDLFEVRGIDPSPPQR